MSKNIVKYTSRDYASAKADIVAYIKERLPQWTDFLPSDFGVVLVEVFSGIIDMFAFYQNVTATESFPVTARLFESLCRQAGWFGYHPHPAAAAQVPLTFTKTDTNTDATIPKGTQVSIKGGGVTFETTEQLYIPAGQSSGSVGGVHGKHIRSQIIGVSTGQQNQQYKLLNQGLVMLTEGANAINVYVDGEKWEEFPSLVWAAGSNGYRVWIDSDREAWIQFGDGTYGEIPALNSQIHVDYIVGGGVNGNVGAYTLTEMSAAPANIESVTNAIPATGGADAETAEELRVHMPALAITRGRAVVRDDYKRLIEAFGEIEKIDIEHPSENVVNVYVLPKGGAEPGESLLASVRDYLADIRMITEDVRVMSPTFVDVDVAATLTLSQDAEDTGALGGIENRLREYLSAGEFSRDLHIHDIYDFFEEEEDVEHATISLLAVQGSSGVNDVTTVSGEVIRSGRIELTTT